MRSDKPKLKALWNALDEAAFGAERILNLREMLPTASEARAKTDIWLRSRQVMKPQEVLIITGRGNQSVGGVGIIRQEILGMLPSLRRRGVVESWKEHTPGSIIVKLAPMSALLLASKRRRDTPNAMPKEMDPKSLEALGSNTLRLLRQLATQNLELLGVSDTKPFVEQEMVRTFAALAGSVPPGENREERLCDAIRRALEEVSD
ncbi:MAG TPA: Smr/MutS family protein [Gemmatimonadaceae bacterium]|nr:Smr/MutS family protein [Gemmatimonadaceae bacterium]